MSKNFFLIVGLSFCIFFFGWVVVRATGVNSLDIKSEDTLPAMFLPVSIIKNGDIYLDQFYGQLIKKYPHPDDKDYLLGMTPFYLKKVDGRYLSAFPIITGILAVPVYLLPVLFGAGADWETVTFLSHVASALIAAVSGGFLFIILKRNFDLSRWKILAILAVYYFGTVNFAMISQGLWQHGTVQLFLILMLLSLFEMQKGGAKKCYFLFGLFSGLAVLSRPTAVLPFGILLLYYLGTNYKVLKSRTKPLLLLMLGFFLCVLFFIYYNSKYYGSVSNQGYSSQITTGWLSPFPISFFGVWVSPSKGILIFSPVFIFSLIGVFLALKKKQYVFLLFALIVLLHTLVISFWKHWYGGWSFGYRMSSDIVPFLVLLLIPFLNSGLFPKLKKLFFLLLGLSILIELYGLVFYDGIWHAAYDLGYENTSWLWSITDSEFAFDIRRVLVKLGLLEKACPKCL